MGTSSSILTEAAVAPGLKGGHTTSPPPPFSRREQDEPWAAASSEARRPVPTENGSFTPHVLMATTGALRLLAMSANVWGMSTTSLGLELRRLREQAGYTLRGLGAKLDVSAAHLSDIEHNRRRPSEALLAGLAYELRGGGTTFSELEVHLTGIDAKTVAWASITPGVRKLFRTVRESGVRPLALLRPLKRAITHLSSGRGRKGS